MTSSTIQNLERLGQRYAPYIFMGEIGVIGLGVGLRIFIDLPIRIAKAILPAFEQLERDYNKKVSQYPKLKHALEFLVPSARFASNVHPSQVNTQVLPGGQIKDPMLYNIVIQDFYAKTYFLIQMFIVAPKIGLIILSKLHDYASISLSINHEAFTKKNFIYCTAMMLGLTQTITIISGLWSRFRSSCNKEPIIYQTPQQFDAFQKALLDKKNKKPNPDVLQELN